MATITIGKRARSLDVAPKFTGITKVVLQVADDLSYTAGDDTGRTLTMLCPNGTQAMCDDILALVSGYRYQPFSADGAILDPAAELGDQVVIKDTTGGIGTMKVRFGPLYTADISAPYEEEIDHEYPYKSSKDRKYTRQLGALTSELKVQAGLISAEVSARETAVSGLETTMNSKFTVQASEISAKVSQESTSLNDAGDTFAWALLKGSWTVKSIVSGVEKTVFQVRRTGAYIDGEIVASSGTIGGYDIKSDRISYKNMVWADQESDADGGIYLGKNGIKLGSKFKVDLNGKVTATDGTFSGTIHAADGTFNGTIHATDGYFTGSVRASEIVYGDNKVGDTETIGGYFSGSGLLGSSVSTLKTSAGINASLGYADDFYSFSEGSLTLNWMKSSAAKINTLTVAEKLIIPEDMYITDRGSMYPGTITIDGTEYNVMRWRSTTL